MPTTMTLRTGLLGLILMYSLTPWPATALVPTCAQASAAAALGSSTSASGLIDSAQVACNRALSLHVHTAHLADLFDGIAPPPGHCWLVLDASFENHMPVDLILGLNYQEAVLIGSIERQLFLLVNGERVYRARLPENGTSEDAFVIPNMGDRVRFEVAYPVPVEDPTQLSLRYYHDQYQPIIVELLDAGSPTSPEADQHEANDLLALSIHGHQRLDVFEGVAAPARMQWLVVDLRGRSLWTTEADARALDVQAGLNDKARQPRVLEYLEAAGLLQARVDGRHAYPRHLELGGLPTNPAFLPEVEAGGLAVFPVPADAEKVELLVQFPLLAGREISRDIRPTARFTLIDGQSASAPETLLEIDDAPVPLSIHRVERVQGYADQSARAGEQLLRVSVSQRNLSNTGGMMRISQRLGFEDGAELIGVFLRGPLALQEPFWLPPGNEPREFELLIRAPAGLRALTISYSGVSGQSSGRLALP
jgi:hypothetical protein